MRANYGKVKNEVIAEMFNVSLPYLRNFAKRMNLTKKNRMPESFTNGQGYPQGYTQKHLVAETATGRLLKKGNVLRHVMR